MDWGSNITYLASTAFKERTTPFGVKDTDRLQHVCVLGRVGSGRAALLARMALQDIERGVGVIILDASGNLGPLVMERLNTDELERLVHLDAADAEYPFSWKAADEFRGTERGEAMFKDVLPSLYGVVRSDLTDFAAEFILKNPDRTVLDLFTLVADEKERNTLIPPDSEEGIKLKTLVDADKEHTTALSESGRYLAKDTMVRNLLGQTEGKVHLSALAERGLVIVDLSRIRIFPTRITPLIKLFAYTARTVSGGGAPIGLYLHDCLRYFSEEDTDSLFSDHSLALTLSDTVYREADLPLREKALTKCGSIVAFQPHQSDLPLAEKVFYPYVTPEELSGLDDGEACVQLTIDEARTKPFFATTLALPERKNVSLQDVLVLARQRYATPRAKVDAQFKKGVEDSKDKKGGPPAFSDAFKNIFAKRAAAAEAGKPNPNLPPTLDGVQNGPTTIPASPPVSAPKPPTTPAPQNVAPQEPPKAPPPVAPPPASLPPVEVAKLTDKATDGIVHELPEEDLRQLLYVSPLPA